MNTISFIKTAQGTVVLFENDDTGTAYIAHKSFLKTDGGVQQFHLRKVAENFGILQGVYHAVLEPVEDVFDGTILALEGAKVTAIWETFGAEQNWFTVGWYRYHDTPIFNVFGRDVRNRVWQTGAGMDHVIRWQSLDLADGVVTAHDSRDALILHCLWVFDYRTGEALWRHPGGLSARADLPAMRYTGTPALRT